MLSKARNILKKKIRKNKFTLVTRYGAKLHQLVWDRRSSTPTNRME
jgi:hypothetical protein